MSTDSTSELSNSSDGGNISRVRPPPSIIRRGLRKKTLSLNPEEREALENLVEEVIMEGGIGDSGSSDDEEGASNQDKVPAGKEKAASGDEPKSKSELMTNRKYYPGQLKVALKHMSDLPPRFSRKLKKAERYLEMNGLSKNNAAPVIAEEDEEEVKKEPAASEEKQRGKEKEKSKAREVQVKEAKKVIRSLLNDMDQYVDETTVSVVVEEAPTTNGFSESDLNSSAASNRNGPISCQDLERELLGTSVTYLTSPSQKTARVVSPSESCNVGNVVGASPYSEISASVSHTEYHTPYMAQTLQQSEGFIQDSVESFYISSPDSTATIPSSLESIMQPYITSLSDQIHHTDIQYNLINNGDCSGSVMLPLQSFSSSVLSNTSAGSSSLSLSHDMHVPPPLPLSYTLMHPSSGLTMMGTSGPLPTLPPPPGLSSTYALPPTLHSNPYTQPFSVPPPPCMPPPPQTNLPLSAIMMPNGEINLSHPQSSIFRFPPPNMVSATVPPFPPPFPPPGSAEAALLAYLRPPPPIVSPLPAYSQSMDAAVSERAVETPTSMNRTHGDSAITGARSAVGHMGIELNNTRVNRTLNNDRPESARNSYRMPQSRVNVKKFNERCSSANSTSNTMPNVVVVTSASSKSTNSNNLEANSGKENVFAESTMANGSISSPDHSNFSSNVTTCNDSNKSAMNSVVANDINTAVPLPNGLVKSPQSNLHLSHSHEKGSKAVDLAVESTQQLVDRVSAADTENYVAAESSDACMSRSSDNGEKNDGLVELSFSQDLVQELCQLFGHNPAISDVGERRITVDRDVAAQLYEALLRSVT